MIDTISIDIQTGSKELTVKDFRHPTKIITSATNKTDGNYVKYQRNIQLFWGDSLEDCGYLPSITYMSFPDPRGGGQKYGNNNRYHIYRITTSLPKLVFGNNISELTEDMFEDIINQLYEQIKLLELPTVITKEDIRSATVSRVDYGKNVILPQGTSMYAIRNILSKVEHRSNSKFSQVQYREGELIRCYIKNRAVIAYDKGSEYNTSLSKYKPPIFSKYIEGELQLGENFSNILRFEVQIQKTSQLKRELKSLKLPEKVSFQDIFSRDISREILTKYWKLNTKGIDKIANDFETSKLHQIFTTLLNRPNRGGPQKVFSKLGFTALAKACGLDAIKQTFRLAYDAKSWRITRENLLIETDSDSPTLFIDKVLEAIEEMESLRLTEMCHDRR